MIVNLTVNNETREVIVPKSWQDVTFKQYCSLIKCKNIIEVLACLYGVSVKDIKGIKDNAVFALIQSPLGFIYDVESAMPTELSEINILGEVKRIPSTYQDIEFGLYLDTKYGVLPEFLKDVKDLKSNEIIERYPILLKELIQYIDTGDYNLSTADKYIEVIENMNCLEVLFLGDFFFSNWILSKDGILEIYEAVNRQTPRYKQVWKSFKKSLGLK